MSAVVSSYQQLKQELLSVPSEVPRLTTSDATGEKLVEILSQAPGAMLVVRDEITGLFVTFYRNDREGGQRCDRQEQH